MKEFDKWAEDYALDYEPLTTKSRREDCLAAYKAGAAIGSDELLQKIMADMLSDGWRQCAFQSCADCAAEVSAERAVSDRLLGAVIAVLSHLRITSYHPVKETPMAILEDAMAEVEAMRKEQE